MTENNWTYWELVERYGDRLGKRMYEEQEAAKKKQWHTPELRKNAVQDVTRDGLDDPDCQPES